MGTYRKGSRVASLRWRDHHGTVTAVRGERVFIRWDGTTFTEDEAHPSEIKPRSRPAPPRGGGR